MIGEKEKGSKIAAFYQEYRQEIKFVATFSIGLLLIFLFIHNDFVADNIIKPITVVESVIASYALDLLGFENYQDGLYISGVGTNRFRMQVLNTCNGVFESAIFLLAFVALQVPWRRKIGWMSIGFLFFHFVNEMRLVTLFIVGSNYSTETFVFFHETFWNYAIVLVALGTFILCANQVIKNPALKKQLEA